MLKVVFLVAVSLLEEDWRPKVSASGSPYAAARIRRAGDMKCVARSSATHMMGYENMYN